MINFDALPTKNEYNVEADVYLAHIEKAEMRKPKDVTKPAYLSLQYRLTRHNGKKAGVMFDAQYDSEKSLMQYKLSRFLTACKIPLKGQMELEDIATLVLNKTIVVDTSIDESGTQPRLQADLFGREVYYTPEEFDEIWNLAHPEGNEFMPVPEDEVPFTETPDTESEEVEY